MVMSFVNKNLFGINIAQNLMNKKQIHYLVDNAHWATDEVGLKITTPISDSQVTNTYYGIRNGIIHFGSFNLVPKELKILKKLSQKKTLIVTCFHIDLNDPRIPLIGKMDSHIKRWHTSCSITKGILVQNGIKKEKISVIPLGVDLNTFSPVNIEKRKDIRKCLGVPDGKVVIGSFQKDGNGWGEGLEPKLIKGPDIFLDAVARLTDDYEIHCLLTGPARGYIKKNLERIGVRYTHSYLHDPGDVAKWFQACDLYIMASRIEGGPKSILESLACGVPLVATKVGMVPDILRDGKNAFLADSEDIEMIAKKSKILLENQKISEKHINNGLRQVQNFSWDIISTRYYKELYSEFLV